MKVTVVHKFDEKGKFVLPDTKHMGKALGDIHHRLSQAARDNNRKIWEAGDSVDGELLKMMLAYARKAGKCRGTLDAVLMQMHKVYDHYELSAEVYDLVKKKLKEIDND